MKNKVEIEVYSANTLFKVGIDEATQAERHEYYRKISKGQIIKMLEKLLENTKEGN